MDEANIENNLKSVEMERRKRRVNLGARQNIPAPAPTPVPTPHPPAPMLQVKSVPVKADSAEYAQDLCEYANKYNIGMKDAYNSLYFAPIAETENKIKLNEDQLYVAKMSGMTPEEYIKYMN